MIATIVVMIRTLHLHKTPPKMIQIDLALKVFPVPVMVVMDIVIVVVSMNYTPQK